MTRDEAIIQVCDILYGYDEVPEAMYKNACNRVREIIQQIDKPEWHKVAEEGVPKEEGLYRLVQENGRESITELVRGEHTMVYASNTLDERSFFNQKNLDKGVLLKVIAWQKIEPYKE